MYENDVGIVRLISIWNKNKKKTVSLLMIPSLKSNEMYFSLPVPWKNLNMYGNFSEGFAIVV